MSFCFPPTKSRTGMQLTKEEDKKLKNENLRPSLMTSCVWSPRCLKLLIISCWYHYFWFTVAHRVLQCSASAVEDKGRENIVSGELLWRQTCLYSYPPVLRSPILMSLNFSTVSLSLVLQMSHAAVSGLCRAIKLQCELYSSRQIAICLDPYCGLGFVLWCLCRYDFWGEKGKD